jgi:hypothetical protein
MNVRASSKIRSLAVDGPEFKQTYTARLTLIDKCDTARPILPYPLAAGNPSYHLPVQLQLQYVNYLLSIVGSVPKSDHYCYYHRNGRIH